MEHISWNKVDSFWYLKLSKSVSKPELRFTSWQMTSPCLTDWTIPLRKPSLFSSCPRTVADPSHSFWYRNLNKFTESNNRFGSAAASNITSWLQDGLHYQVSVWKESWLKLKNATRVMQPEFKFNLCAHPILKHGTFSRIKVVCHVIGRASIIRHQWILWVYWGFELKWVLVFICGD